METPDGTRTVRQVCARIGSGPGIGNNPIYNDVQCGHGPPNNAGDEHICPGRVDRGSGGCNIKGPTWNLERFYTAANTAPSVPQPEPEPEPQLEAQPVSAPQPESPPEPAPQAIEQLQAPAVSLESAAPSVAVVPDTPPSLNDIGNVTLRAGEELALVIEATDDDGSVPSLFLEGAPEGASFDDNGDGSRTLRWNPEATVSGSFQIDVIAMDADNPQLLTRKSFAVVVMEEQGVATDVETETTSIEISGETQVVIDVIGPAVAEIGRPVNTLLRVRGSDGLMPQLDVAGLPDGAAMIRNDDGSYTLVWTPSSTQIGFHDMEVVLNPGSQVLRNLRIVVVSSRSENRAPVFEAISAQILATGVPFELTVRPQDPEGIAPALQVIDAPAGASFDDNFDGSRTFRWQPESADAGAYTIRFVAIDHDDASLVSTQDVTLVVQ